MLRADKITDFTHWITCVCAHLKKFKVLKTLMPMSRVQHNTDVILEASKVFRCHVSVFS